MKNVPTVAFYTLGCKLNYSETSSIGRNFIENGYKKVDFNSGADVFVINTCSVTENADKECSKLVRKALSISPEAFIAVVGCYAQLKPEKVAEIPGVDLVLGASEKFNVLEFIQKPQKKIKPEIHSCAIEEVHDYVSTYSIGDRTRSFLKVQDGCDYSCTYCTIPLARGMSRSDTIANVVKQASEIADKGVKEIVISGVNVGDFGKLSYFHNEQNTKTESFLDLIKQLDKIDGIERFRISSIEPNLLKDEIIEFVAQSEKFMPHFHIPLQSGSNNILALMKRRYKSELYVERIKKIKLLIPHCCIGVDVIVGFPGELDPYFLETYRFLNELPVSYLHVFTYSERDNTEALKIKDVVPVSIRKDRNKMLRILSVKKKRKFYEEFIGLEKKVLVESEIKDGFMFGFTDNYMKVKVLYDPLYINKIIQVKIIKINQEGIAEGFVTKDFRFSNDQMTNSELLVIK